MKYSNTNPPLQCFIRQSSWYQRAGKVKIKGVLWHSTGAPNTTLKRYVQPDANDPNKSKLLELIGVNKNNNSWNRPGLDVGVHAFIGQLASGEVTTVQTGDWDKEAWGCGPGTIGSCNNGWIQFEICEDYLNDPIYFEKIYREGIELTAYLCKLYNLDPYGTVTYCGVQVPVILCHQDSNRLGLGSAHEDVLHWLPKYGKSMQTVRDDVSALLTEKNNEEEDDMVYYKYYDDIPEYYQNAILKVMSVGALKGTGNKELNVSEDFCRTLTVLDRLGLLDE